jgi:hypothetical protein
MPPDDEHEEPWQEAAMWAYQFTGALTISYHFEERDIVPLLDVLSALAEGTPPLVTWPAVVPSHRAAFEAPTVTPQADGIVRGPLAPGDEAWAILYEDPDHGNEVFSGAGAEQAAVRRFEQARQTWNCTLFRQYAPMGWRHPGERGDTPPPTRRTADGLAEAWAEVEAVLPEGWTMGLFDYGQPGPFNPGPGEEFHTPRYEAAAHLGILSSPPKDHGRSDESPAAALHALAVILLDRSSERWRR